MSDDGFIDQQDLLNQFLQPISSDPIFDPRGSAPALHRSASPLNQKTSKSPDLSDHEKLTSTVINLTPGYISEFHSESDSEEDDSSSSSNSSSEIEIVGTPHIVKASLSANDPVHIKDEKPRIPPDPVAHRHRVDQLIERSESLRQSILQSRNAHEAALLEKNTDKMIDKNETKERKKIAATSWAIGKDKDPKTMAISDQHQTILHRNQSSQDLPRTSKHSKHTSKNMTGPKVDRKVPTEPIAPTETHQPAVKEEKSKKNKHHKHHSREKKNQALLLEVKDEKPLLEETEDVLKWDEKLDFADVVKKSKSSKGGAKKKKHSAAKSTSSNNVRKSDRLILKKPLKANEVKRSHHAKKKSKKPVEESSKHTESESDEGTPGTDSSEKTTIRIYTSYDLFFQEEKAMSVSQSKKKATTPVLIWKRGQQANSEADKTFSFIVNHNDATPEDFKELALPKLDNMLHNMTDYIKRFPEDHFTWYGMDRTSVRMVKKWNIDEPSGFKKFIDFLNLHDDGDDHWPFIRLSMMDPGAAEQKKILEKKQEDRVQAFLTKDGNSTGRDQLDSSQPTMRLSEAMQEIRLTHSGHSGSAVDHARYIDPRNSTFWFRLTPDRLEVWAKTWIDHLKLGKNDIDVNTPPKTPMFKTYLRGKEPLDNVGPITAISAQSTSGTQEDVFFDDARMNQERYCGRFADFLTFARIQPDDNKTRTSLETLGLDHWSAFKPTEFMTPIYLENKGLTIGAATKLILAYPRFQIRVSGDIELGGFTPIED